MSRAGHGNAFLPGSKKPIFAPFFILMSKCQLLEIESGFNFPGLLVISGVLSCEEEEREQPDFLKTDQSLTWDCLPNPALQ